ncbi:MAG: 3-keto-disaccharide hydrolase [Myxococcaceae bacterium]
MRGFRFWLGVAWLAGACGGGRSADRPDGRLDSGTVSDAGVELDGGTDGGMDGGTVDAGVLGRIGPLGETSWKPLLDSSLSHFYKWMPSKGRDDDPEGLFRMEDDMLHVLGIAPTDQEQDFGYLATRDDLANFRARVQQRWGTNTFAPRKDQLRDSGLIYHLRGEDKIWPQCIEFQIMEHSVGDLWVLSGTGVTATVHDPSASEPTFDALGQTVDVRTGRVIKWWEAEKLTDWNQLELIASGQDSAQIVNGQWLNGATNIVAESDGGWGVLDHGHLALQAEGAEVFYRAFEVRPLAYLSPPDGAVVLFDGSNADAWRGADGGTAGWKVADGSLEVVPGAGDLRTREAYGDVRLHVEFAVPPPQPNAAEQDRGNSGVYLQSRYEVQILDSFGHSISDANDCGAIYGVKDPAVNEAFPPGMWQSYDIVFHPPVWNGTTKQSNARITVVWNGSVVQQDTEVPGSTTLGDDEAPGAAPLRLQDHGHPVRFRNIWLEQIDAGTTPGSDGGTDGGVGPGPDGGSDAGP